MKFILFMSLVICMFTKENNAVCQNSDLPLRIKSAPVSAYPMVFYITGDAGWNTFDNKMANEYVEEKMPYVAINSFRYFWSKKNPDQFTKDIVPVLYRYQKEWNKKEIIMIGYSFGAEIIPFLMNRLPNDLKEKIKLIALITPSQTSDFTIHLNDMLTFNGKYEYDVVAEIGKISTTNIFCFFGANETPIFDASHQQMNLKICLVKGGHHFSDAKAVMKQILDELK